MNSPHNVHPRFRRLPSLTLSFKRWFIGLINRLLVLERLIWQKKSAVKLQRHLIPRADGSALSIIKMTPPGISRPMPCMLYFHGGAFALSYTSSHVNRAQRYAEEADCFVVFVDYRLAPAHPFPAGQEDCHTALQWTVDHADLLGIDKHKIAVKGDSAGGALAASITHMSQDRETIELCAQLLIYPVTDMDRKTRSAREFTDTPVWNSHSNDAMWEAYLKDYKPGEVPDYASPIHREDFKDLPPAYIETAEFDPLHDEAVDYANCLIEAGVEVVLNETKGTVHGYDSLGNSHHADDAMMRRVSFLRDAFARA